MYRGYMNDTNHGHVKLLFRGRGYVRGCRLTSHDFYLSENHCSWNEQLTTSTKFWGYDQNILWYCYTKRIWNLQYGCSKTAMEMRGKWKHQINIIYINSHKYVNMYVNLNVNTDIERWIYAYIKDKFSYKYTYMNKSLNIQQARLYINTGTGAQIRGQSILAYRTDCCNPDLLAQTLWDVTWDEKRENRSLPPPPTKKVQFQFGEWIPLDISDGNWTCWRKTTPT